MYNNIHYKNMRHELTMWTFLNDMIMMMMGALVEHKYVNAYIKTFMYNLL